MRNEQHENHISHLNATQSLRNSPNENSQNSQLQIRSPSPLNTSSPDIHDPSTQNEKKRDVDTSNNVISQSPEKRIMTNNPQLLLETQKANIPQHETDV